MLKVYTDFVEDLEPLTDAEVGRLFKAMLKYAADETEIELTGNERITWATARKHIRAQWSEYRDMCERNKENATRYDSARLDTTCSDSARLGSTRDKNKNKNKNNKRIIKEQEQYISIEKERKKEIDEPITETIRRLTEAM